MPRSRRAHLPALQARTAFLALLALAIGPAAAPPTAQAAPQDVSIVDFAFEPATVTVNQGDVVTWKNDGRAGHTVTSDDGSTIVSETLRPNSVFATLFDKPGTYHYRCRLHPEMRGTVIVRAAAVPTTTGPTPPAGTLPPGFKPGGGTSTEDEGPISSGGGVRVRSVVILGVAVGVGILLAASGLTFLRRRRSRE